MNGTVQSGHQRENTITNFLSIAALGMFALIHGASSPSHGLTSPLIALGLLMLLLAVRRASWRWRWPLLLLTVEWHWMGYADLSLLALWLIGIMLLWRLARHAEEQEQEEGQREQDQALPAPLPDMFAQLHRDTPRHAGWTVLLMLGTAALATLATTSPLSAARLLSGKGLEDLLGHVILLLQAWPVCAGLAAWSAWAASSSSRLPATHPRETLIWWLACALLFALVGLAGQRLTYMGIIDGSVLLWPLMIWASLRLGKTSVLLAILLVPTLVNAIQLSGVGGTPAPSLVLGASGLTLLSAIQSLGAAVLYGWRCWSLGAAEPVAGAGNSISISTEARAFALRPTLMCAGSAVVMGVMALVFSLQQANWQSEFVAERLVMETNRILANAEEGLKNILEHDPARCGPQQRQTLARVARQTAFVRDLGVLNGAGEPLCQNGEGLPAELLNRTVPEGLSYLFSQPEAEQATQAVQVALLYRSPGGTTAYALLDVPAITWYVSGFSARRGESLSIRLDEHEIVRHDGDAAGSRLVRRTLVRYMPHFLLEARLSTGQQAVMAGVVPLAGTLFNLSSVLLVIAILIASLRDQERRARLKARAESQARSDFLAIMSHEIRTPLNGLLGNLELLQSGAAAPGALLDDACTSARTLLALLNNMLDMSKIDAGKLTLAPAPFALRALVTRVLHLHAVNARSRQLRLSEQLDPALPAALLGDALRIEQILGNLLSNAIKFTPPQGRVVLSVTRDADNGRIDFVVEDEGVGMAPAQLQRLGEPFYQAASRLPSAVAGSGLGLSICRRLVLLMGGDMTISSREGQGTRVQVSLPLAPATLAAAEAGNEALAPAPVMAAPAAPQANRTISKAAPDWPLLIVDDHPIALDLLGRQLQQLGLTSLAAEDAAQAYACFTQAPRLAAVLTDQNMPGGSGIDLARRMRATATAADSQVPVILCTADLTLRADDLIAAGVIDAVLYKPYTLDELRRLLAPYIAFADAQQRSAASTASTAATASPHWPGGRLDLLMQTSAGDAATAARLLEALHQANLADLAALEQALSQADWPAAVKAAHRIKGAARMLGALELGQAAEHCEQAARAQEGATATACVAQVRLLNQALPALVSALAQ